ncbi:MAG: ABC transporter ATP-binding protein [Ostreibacterium sp.]
MPQIRFNHVEKYYGAFKALPALNLTLDNGEFTVLVGPSGCGKSTTLRILAGLENLTSGEIYFDDQPISHLPAKSRDLAMVFQDYALYPHMNIAKNMSFALRLQKAPKKDIEKKVNEVAEMLGIAHLLDRKPSALSGGQRQRVAMGRALVRDTSTFLFDEPLSNLDAKLRAKMRTELAEMRDQLDKNMVYVTHDQIEAMTLGQRIVVMNNGDIQQQGSPEALYKYPQNIFVASFIGSPGMNFLDAVWQRDGDQASIAGADFTFAWHQGLLDMPNNQPITLGFRPSKTRLVAATQRDMVLFTGKIIMVEYLGSSSLATMTCQGKEIQIELPENQIIQTQTQATIGVDYQDLYLFDQHSGQTLFPLGNPPVRKY